MFIATSHNDFSSHSKASRQGLGCPSPFAVHFEHLSKFSIEAVNVTELPTFLQQHPWLTQGAGVAGCAGPGCLDNVLTLEQGKSERNWYRSDAS